MNQETFYWVIGISILPAITYCIGTSWLLYMIKKEVSVLLTMHRHPDQYGFGNQETNKIIADNTKAMHALVHYTKWLAEQMTGKTPPPPIED